MNKPRFKDLACPRCGQCDQFHVDVIATAYLDQCGLSVESDYDWDSESGIVCLDCNFESTVVDFVRQEAKVQS